MSVEFLWFADCPNHAAARRLLLDVLRQKGASLPIADTDATDPPVARRLRFPGSPMIRVNGEDIEPGFIDPGDYTPRCRLYQTREGLAGLPERRWIEDAVARALRAEQERR